MGFFNSNQHQVDLILRDAKKSRLCTGSCHQTCPSLHLAPAPSLAILKPLWPQGAWTTFLDPAVSLRSLLQLGAAGSRNFVFPFSLDRLVGFFFPLLDFLLLSSISLKINLLWLKGWQTENPGDWFPVFIQGSRLVLAGSSLQGPTEEASQALELNSFCSLRSSKHFRNMSSFGVRTDLDSKCPPAPPGTQTACIPVEAILST